MKGFHGQKESCAFGVAFSIDEFVLESEFIARGILLRMSCKMIYYESNADLDAEFQNGECLVYLYYTE